MVAGASAGFAGTDEFGVAAGVPVGDAPGAAGCGSMRIGWPFGPEMPGCPCGIGISVTSTSSISKIRSAFGGIPGFAAFGPDGRAHRMQAATE